MSDDISGTYGPIAARVPVGGEANGEVLYMRNADVRFAHDCKQISDGRRLRSAPMLQIGNGHTIVNADPLTIVASILCSDCGLHGWVTDGKWVST